MAFDPQAFAKTYVSGGGNTTKETTSGFNPSDPSVYSSDNTSYAGRVNLKTSEGLYNLAVQNGLQKEANVLLQRQSGEEVNKIFSGGAISDIFDTINALQYGVVGILKGKTFIEGVKNRQSFTDKDAFGDYGAPGLIGGIAMDIAVDPLTYYSFGTAPAAKAVWKGFGKLGDLVIGSKVTKPIFEAVGDVIKPMGKFYETREGGTKLGKWVTQKLAWSLGRDPIFLDTYQRTVKNIAVSSRKIVDLGKVVAKISPEVASKIVKTVDDQGRLGRVALTDLAPVLQPEEYQAVARLYQYIDDLGAEATKLGIVNQDTFEKNIGEYLKQAYDEYEKANKLIPFDLKTPRIKGTKSRVEVLSEARKADRIKNPAYLLMKSALDLTADVENAKLFAKVNKNFASNAAQEGFTQLPKTKAMGELAGKYVPDNMVDFLNEVIRKPSTKIEMMNRKLVGNFKFFKVVMNPATHIRNVMSNMVLNWWKLGMVPGSPTTIKAQAIALKEMKMGGKYIDEATPLGYNLDTFASAELKTLLDSPEVAAGMKHAGQYWNKVKETLSNLYQGEENFAKLSAYIYNRTTKKLDPEEAWKLAEAATFNYAQVTPFIRRMRESIFGVPFITFTYKATPLAIETAIKNPSRIGVIGKIKEGIEEQADIELTERERAAEPPWVKDGFYVKLPGKDAEGRSRYLDLTYILPFGDLISGNFFSRGTNMETGTPESVPSAVASKSPFINLVKELVNNQDFYGKRIWNDSDPLYKQHKDMMRHIAITYLPPVATEVIPGGYNEDGTRNKRGFRESLTPNDEPDMKRTTQQEVLRNLGIKIQPINVDIQENYAEWNRQKALKTLLRENGVIGDLNITYKKDKEDDE